MGPVVFQFIQLVPDGSLAVLVDPSNEELSQKTTNSVLVAVGVVVESGQTVIGNATIVVNSVAGRPGVEEHFSFVKLVFWGKSKSSFERYTTLLSYKFESLFGKE